MDLALLTSSRLFGARCYGGHILHGRFRGESGPVKRESWGEESVLRNAAKLEHLRLFDRPDDRRLARRLGLKRAFDLFFAGTLLLALLPMFGLPALAIKLVVF